MTTSGQGCAAGAERRQHATGQQPRDGTLGSTSSSTGSEPSAAYSAQTQQLGFDRDAHGVAVSAMDADGETQAQAATGAPVHGSDRELSTVVAGGRDPDSEATLTSTLPHTSRLPETVSYVDEPPYPLYCTVCQNRYPSTAEGMRQALACHADPTDVDRDAVPICAVELPLTIAERANSDYTAAQLRMLAAVYMGHQQAFDPRWEYDIVLDSMRRLKEYVGIDKDAIDALVADGLVKRDCRQPHLLFTVTPAGRDELQLSHPEGAAHSDGAGDLGESSLHVAMTEGLRRLLAQEFVGDPNSPAVVAKSYHEVVNGRLDAAALSTDGEVVVAGEAELLNHDIRQAVPEYFDTMAACNPEAAIWIVKSREAAHDVLQALHDPAEGQPRVSKTYSKRVAPQEFSIDTAGFTDVYTFTHLQRQQLDTDSPRDGWP